MKQRQRARLSLRISLKQVMVASSLLLAALTIGFIVLFNTSNVQLAKAAIADDYRSKASGNWSSSSTWERYNGSSWVNASSAPVYTVENITIRNGHTVTITSSTTTDQLTIEAGAQVTVNSGVTVTIYNYTGTDVKILGILKNAGTVTMNSGALMICENGGKYQHNFTTTGGTIPTATWNTGSTCEVIGYTTNSSTLSGCNQQFYHFTWNCPNQTSASLVSLGGGLANVNGNMTVTSTGSGNFQLAATGTSTTTVDGNYVQSGGIMKLSNTSGSTTLNIAGNYTMTGGTLQKGSGSGTVNFNGTSTQTYLKSGGTISGSVNFAILSGAIVDFGTSVIDGSTGTFTLNSGGGIITAHASGLTSSGSNGTIQVTGTRTFGTGADYTFNGSCSQASGNGVPSTVRNLTVNNSSGLTLTSSTSATNLLTMTNGIITTNSNELGVSNTSTSSIVGYSSTKYVIGNLRRSVSTSGTYEYPLGTSANYELISLTLSGVTGFTSILGTFVRSNPITLSIPLLGIKISNTDITDMLDYGYWTMTPNSTITGGSYSVTLNEKGHSNSGALAGSHCVLKRESILSSWESKGTHNNNDQRIASGVVTAVRAGLTSFSDFAVGKAGSGAFPIKLIYFNADLNGDLVEFTWATAAELNNDFFTVERSEDGFNFEQLFKKPGAGNSTNNLYYTGIDESPIKGYSYYRLKQTDYDGHFTYSEIKTVKYKAGAEEEDELKITSVAPNPFSEKFRLSFMLKKATVIELQLLTSSGQTVFRDVFKTNDGMNQYEYVDQAGLPTGIYFMILIYNDKKITQKIIKN